MKTKPNLLILMGLTFALSSPAWSMEEDNSEKRVSNISSYWALEPNPGKILKQAVKKGISEDQYYAGLQYDIGYGVKQNPRKIYIAIPFKINRFSPSFLG